MADRRKTLAHNASFYSIVAECFNRGQSVHLLYDQGGLQRASGRVIRIDPPGPQCTFTLHSGQRIQLNSLIAVNGVFADDFSEC